MEASIFVKEILIKSFIKNRFSGRPKGGRLWGPVWGGADQRKIIENPFKIIENLLKIIENPLKMYGKGTVHTYIHTYITFGVVLGPFWGP